MKPHAGESSRFLNHKSCCSCHSALSPSSTQSPHFIVQSCCVVRLRVGSSTSKSNYCCTVYCRLCDDMTASSRDDALSIHTVTVLYSSITSSVCSHTTIPLTTPPSPMIEHRNESSSLNDNLVHSLVTLLRYAAWWVAFSIFPQYNVILIP